MKKKVREIARTFGIVVLVMVVLPAFYRLWMVYDPPSPHDGGSLAEMLARAADDYPMRMLMTPLAQWSAADREKEPKIARWLESHAKTILPWEWSVAARQKDPEGYERLRRDVTDEVAAAVAAALESARADGVWSGRSVWAFRQLKRAAEFVGADRSGAVAGRKVDEQERAVEKSRRQVAKFEKLLADLKDCTADDRVWVAALAAAIRE